MSSNLRVRSIHDTSTVAIAGSSKVSVRSVISHWWSIGFLSISASIHEPGTEPKEKNIKTKKLGVYIFASLFRRGVVLASCVISFYFIGAYIFLFIMAAATSLYLCASSSVQNQCCGFGKGNGRFSVFFFFKKKKVLSSVTSGLWNCGCLNSSRVLLLYVDFFLVSLKRTFMVGAFTVWSGLFFFFRSGASFGISTLHCSRCRIE